MVDATLMELFALVRAWPVMSTITMHPETITSRSVPSSFFNRVSILVCICGADSTLRVASWCTPIIGGELEAGGSARGAWFDPGP